MDVPAQCYCQANDVQRHDCEEILKNYSNLIKWRADGNDTILDIGSGSGDVTNDFILPILPKGFRKLIGVDISEDMVEYSKSNYSNSKVSFEKWDMAGDPKLLLEKHPEGFDHVFSFYTLHWHRDQGCIVQNIYELLNINGDCLLTFLADSDVLDVVSQVVNLPKWSTLIKDSNMCSMPWRHRVDRVESFQNLLHSAGFRKCMVHAVNKTYTYKNIDEIKRNITAINSSLKYLTHAQKEEYFHDFIDAAFKLKLCENIEDGKDCCYHTTYTLMIAYAQK